MGLNYSEKGSREVLDLILLLIACFVIFLFFVPLTVIGIDIIRALFGQSKPKTNYQSHENQLVKDSIEDTEEETDGDGLMLFDDLLFPPEEDDD
jgi:hypothetical protein